MIWNLCIGRPVLTIVVYLILGIFGVISLFRMPVQENPEVEFPVVSVNVVLPGASPEVIESDIVEPLESEINTIQGIRQLTSTAREQSASITAEFELWRNIDVAAQDVRDAVERGRRRLPLEAEAPIVRKLELDAQPVMWITLIGDERWDDIRLTDYGENTLAPRLETVRGVGQIRIGGRRLYAVRIRMDPARLAAHQMTVSEAVAAIRANNVDLPTGRIEGSRREFLIRARGQFDSAAPFNNLVLGYRGGSPVRLSDIGEAVDGVEDDRQQARFSGQQAIGLGVIKQSGANTVELAEEMRERIERISADFPPGLRYVIATDASLFIRESINDLMLTIGVAVVLVVLVVLAFLRSVRGTFVTAMAMPTSLLVGLSVIGVLNFSINVLTMMAFILVIGIVIDDAIVVLERAYTHLEKGEPAEKAARTGTTEVAFPVIANTLSLAAVFIPIAFTGGLVGRFMREFGLTVTATVFASTAVALTLTPMLCSRLLRLPKTRGRTYRWSEERFRQMERAYHWLLDSALRHRALTVLIGLAAFGLGLLALAFVPREFAAAEDRASFMVAFETPQGATLNETDDFARQIEAVLENMPEVRHQFLVVGLGWGGPGDPNRGRAFVRLTPRSERDRHQVVVMQDLRRRLDQLPAGRAFVTELTPGGIGGSPIALVLQHQDLERLAAQQEAVVEWMQSQPNFYVGVRSDLELNNPQVDVVIQRDKAAQLGVSVQELSNALRLLFASASFSRIERGGQSYEVISEIIGRGQLAPNALRDIHVRASGGNLVSLDNLVNLQETIGPSQIQRFNRIRAATISANTPPDVPLGDAVDRLESHLQSTLPPEFDYEFTGTSQIFAESFYYLTVAVIFSVIFIYLVLAAQFESFLYPLTIMMALPLATVGAFGSLWFFGLNLNVYAFIGLIMLLGLVTKNSILLIDYTLVQMQNGADAFAAAREAARVRFRPILMTAISTVLGISPIALGFGAGAEARSPLGVSVAFGLLGSTFLTLVIIPVVFTLMNQAQNAVTRRLRRSGTWSEAATVQTP
jgi:multidrug efflux pump